MSTRTSARLVKAKGKRVTTGMDETQDNLGDDGNFEQVESEKEDQPPPRKRQRAATKSTTGVARKKQVRGKQGRLAGLITMPIDIFTEASGNPSLPRYNSNIAFQVASHLLPVDIISLARLNKFFRNLLMHRSAIHIWHGAMRNVKGLPPCPPGMSEPHYLALLFSKTCSMCGAAARARMDHVLFVRLCGSCRNAELMPLETVPMVIMPLVHRSTSTAPMKRRSAGEFVLRAEFNDVLAQFQEKKRSGDSNALEAWIKERIENVEKRRTHSQELIRFLISLECERDQELNDAKTARRLEINRRLGELGWTDKDLEFGWWSSKQRAWADLVSQPKPLTERIWSNIRPKLIPLLEINREERLEMERGTRKRSRRVRLSELIRGLKDQVSPTLAFKIKHPLYSFAERGNTAHLQAPFPDFVYALDWPLVKNLYENDTTVEEMEVSFEAHRNEIAALISEWKNRIQSQLANLVREGQELQGAILEPANIISDDDSDPFASMSDDLKLLLRADTLFSRTTSLYSLKQPSTYGTILFSEDLVGSVNPISLWSTVPRDPLSLDHIRLHPEAREVARALLADMGKPNASYLEMQGIGLDLVCGRCHMGGPRTWEQLILHYLQQNQVYESVQKSASNSSDPGIEYKNVHDPALYPDRPMVQYYSAHDSDDNEELEDEMSGVQVCKLCAKIPAADGVAAHKSAVLRHIRDVHGIAEPKVGEHYSPRMTSITDMFGLGMDAYDSDDSYGCDCPFHQMFGGGSDYGSGYGYGYDDEDEYEEEYDDDYGWW